MRYTTAGESHGRALCAIVSGVPAGVPVDLATINTDLKRRQGGYGRGGRQRIETDRATVLSGIRFGATIGSPVCLTVANRDWDNWTDVMAAEGEKPVGVRETAPRPGHADLGGVLKTGSDDMRDILERASARETAARVAAGGIAKAVLGLFGVQIASYVESIGSAACDDVDPAGVDLEAVEACDVRCPDAEVAQAMRDEIDAARADGESLGGVFVVTASGLVPGLGSYAEAARRLDADLGASVLSIPAIKGVEFGDGFAAAKRRGSTVHDEIRYTQGTGFSRATNRAGGLEGGMTNGELLVVRAAMKPIPTLMRPLGSVDLDTHEPIDASKERSDVCAVPAAAVVAEAEVAFALARAYLDTFGRDSADDMVAAWDRYRDRVSR
ncbi:MAG TPA: chorismate synthase [Coriobacteriia bacterium]|nr:chorismate synthase [Coriobacteriia bacterium]